MLMTLRRYLRQVGHCQHLPTFTETTQQLADNLGSRAANTHVHFVEDQGRYARGLRGDDLNRQADP
ncbi:hypothetical protein D3C86_1976370 [compost metagenome]